MLACESKWSSVGVMEVVNNHVENGRGEMIKQTFFVVSLFFLDIAIRFSC